MKSSDALIKQPSVLQSQGVILVLQLALVLGIFGIWEVIARMSLMDPVKFGQPSRIWFHLVEALANGELWRHLKVTLYEELIGFGLGTVLGTAVGLGLWWSPTLSRILEPFAVIFNSIPKIALAPPMIVWFGIYETSKIVLAASICVIVAWISAYRGVILVDRDLLDMVRAVGGSRWEAFRKVVIPSALPWIISAVKINIGFALIGAVVGEFVASNHGLGFMAVQAGMLFQISQLWMVVFAIIALAAAQYYLVLWLESYLFRWSGDAVAVRGAF